MKEEASRSYEQVSDETDQKNRIVAMLPAILNDHIR